MMKNVSELSNSQFVNSQLKEGGRYLCARFGTQQMYKQNTETCSDGRFMHVCKGFSEKLCDGSPAPSVYACVKKGAAVGGWAVGW